MKTTMRSEQDEAASLAKPVAGWRAALRDGALLLIPLAAANWFLARSDPGWQGINPTPWLVLPLVLGGRSGTVAGLIGALFATAGVLGLLAAAGDPSPGAFFSDNSPYFLALLAAGVVGAIIHHLGAGPARRLRRKNLDLSSRNARLEEDAALYRANEAGLQEALLLHGAETAALSGEIQRLFSGASGRFDDDLLSLLEREFGVVSAAIYRDETGRSRELARVAATATGDSSFPDHLPEPGHALADAALATGKMATWRSPESDDAPMMEAPLSPVADSDNDARPHLAAIPWRWSPETGDGARALLLIGRMEFGQISWETFARVEAVFGWCMARIEPAPLDSAHARPLPGRILPSEEFHRRVEQARRLESDLHLPGRVILFAADPQAPRSALLEFIENLPVAVAPGDFLGAVGEGPDAPLAVGLITPAPSAEAGEQIARQILARLGTSGEAVQHHVFNLAEAAQLAADSPTPTVVRKVLDPHSGGEKFPRPTDNPAPVSAAGRTPE